MSMPPEYELLVFRRDILVSFVLGITKVVVLVDVLHVWR